MTAGGFGGRYAAGAAGSANGGDTSGARPIASDTRTGGTRLRDRVRKGPSPIHGNGCFARIAFKAGDFIGTYQGPAARRDGTYVLWISDDHIHWAGRSGRNLLRWLNHSDAPNAAFDGFDLYALAEISVGEEITFDYSAGAVEAK